MTQQLKPLHLACSDDDLRPDLQIIQIKNGIASATNGTVLVKIDLEKTCELTPEDIQTLEGKNIHKEAWKEMHKCDLLQFDEEGIEVRTNGIKKRLFYQPTQTKIWDDDAIIESIRAAGVAQLSFVSYDPRLIQILSKIFQHDSLCFSFSPDNKGTICFPYQHSGMMAVLMPKVAEDITRWII
jgi:hypothetical protein